MKRWIKENPVVSVIIAIALAFFFIVGPGYELIKFIVLLSGFLILAAIVLFALVFVVAYFLQVFLGIRVRWLFDFLEVVQMERMLHRMPKEKKHKRE